MQFALTDNPTLEEETIDTLRSTYTGHTHQRLIEGQWVGATGLIYQHWKEGGAPTDPVKAVVGVDWAGSGIFAAVLILVDRHKNGCVVAERIYDNSMQDPISDVEQVHRTSTWAREWVENAKGVPNDIPILAVGDPTTPRVAKQAFRDHLGGPGGRGWLDAINDVKEGLTRTASILEAGRLTVSVSCERLIAELGEYHWDPRAQERGEDKPAKTFDHACDALRYAVMHVYGRVRIHVPVFE